MFVRKLGAYADSVSHVTGKIVLPWVVLWFQLLENLHLVRIETQLLVASVVPLKPDKLT
jgi:hypothetical protein